ncbi:MAG TPA: hypothetical protein VGR36_04990 [Candidatus Acidoferrales bacterium]|nr:hypothetical protein [Candidatus Acidoferrales bacterium]
MRTSKSFTIDEDIEEFVATTRGDRSASDRVNELLRRGILQEQLEKLEREAATFFAGSRNAERTGTRAFQRASKQTLTRD